MNTIYYLVPVAILGIAVLAGVWINSLRTSSEQEIKFTRIDLNNHHTGYLTQGQLLKEVDDLLHHGYKLTSKNEVSDYINCKANLSENSIMVVMDEKHSRFLQPILPSLLKSRINLVIFLPFILRA